MKAGLSNLFSNEEIYFHSFQVITSTVDTVSIDLKYFRHLFPSMFDKTEGILLLAIILITLVIFSILGFNRYVGIKIYLTFLFPFIAILIYFLSFGISVMDAIESRELTLVKAKLINFMSSSQSVWAQAELDQQTRIKQ
ncbi:hypothetical protein MJH12_10195, partial [bacterium]|nr:hypothetical protein [bacterium]